MAVNPYVNRVDYGSTTLIDISDTTAIESDVASGKTFYLASGQQATGTLVPSRLPSGYTELSYIEASGTQYFLTGIIPNSKTKVDCKFQMTAAAGANEAVYGSNEFFFFRRNTGLFRAATNVGYCEFAADSSNGWHTITMIPTGAILTYANNPAIGTMVTGNPTTQIAAFAYYNGAVAFQSKARIAILRVWSGETLTRDYVPAKNSSNVAGMYDLVNNTFKTSAVGAFIAGDPV